MQSEQSVLAALLRASFAVLGTYSKVHRVDGACRACGGGGCGLSRRVDSTTCLGLSPCHLPLVWKHCGDNHISAGQLLVRLSPSIPPVGLQKTYYFHTAVGCCTGRSGMHIRALGATDDAIAVDLLHAGCSSRYMW